MMLSGDAAEQSFHPIACARRDLQDGQAAVDLLDVVETGVEVEIEVGKEIELGQHGQGRLLEQQRVLERLVFTFGHTEQRYLFGFANVETDDWSREYHVFSWGAVPYAEYAFLSGMFRPFVTVQLGFMGVAGEIESGRNDTDFHALIFVIGGGGGGHVFLADNLSLDATLLMSGNLGGGEYEGGPGDDDFGVGLFELSLLLGISGWI